MILAAGLGTRLRPLTDHTPKALVEVNGVPLLEILIRRLKQNGIREIIVNAHHFADQIVDFIEYKKRFDIRIEISQEKELLDTGGGLKKAAWFFDDGKPFLLHNADVLTTLDYAAMLKTHREKAALATLAVRRRTTSRYFLFDANQRLCGWESVADGQKKMAVAAEHVQRYSFMGIHIISPAIFTQLPAKNAFSIVQAYLDLTAAGQKIYGFPADEYKWIDAGRKEHLQKAAKEF